MAGGLGTRAKPFTDFSPKPMLPVFDRPLVEYIVRYLSRFDELSQILIITNLESGKGRQIKNYFEGKEALYSKKIVFVDDPDEGTGGAILNAKPNLADVSDFLVWFSDNLAPIDVHDFIRFHKEKNAIATVAVSRLRREETGFVEIADNGFVKRFLEKPTVRSPMPECLGIYIFSKKVLEYLEKTRAEKWQVNLSFDVLSKMPEVGGLYAYDIGDKTWIDVEGPAKLDRNTNLVREILKEMHVI